MSFGQGAHSLSEFVAHSMEQPIQIEGLPENMNMNVSRAAKLFGKMSDVHLKPLSEYERYFSGWFNDSGQGVRTTDGRLLFTIFSVDLARTGMHRLRIEPEGLKLLEAALL